MKIPRLLLTAILIVGSYILLKAVRPIIPSSVITMYMFFIIIGILLYMTYDEESTKGLVEPIKRLFGDPKMKVLRGITFVVLPVIGAYIAYSLVKPSFDPPVELRTIHPAPPSTTKIFGKTYNLLTLKNPLREDKENFERHVKEGGEIYFKNCFYCHGDKLNGKGHYAEGFNPLPLDFTDVGTIAQLSESFVFWRIATGGPGLPKESTPWLSAMPIWEHFLSEEEIWKVTMFLYDYTGYAPRTWEGKHE